MFPVCKITTNQKMTCIYWNILESCVSINQESVPKYGPETTLREIIHELGFKKFNVYTIRTSSDTNVLDVPISHGPLCHVTIDDIQEVNTNTINNIVYDTTYNNGFYNHGILF